LFPNLVFNAPLSYASIELGITGPTAMVAAQEASGEAAIAWGADVIEDDAADVCLAGGAEELGPVVHQVLRETGVTTSGVPRPLDPAADGACLGEGAAVLVLEPLARARARGAKVYARLSASSGRAVPAPVHGWPRDPAPVAETLRPLVRDADLVMAAASGNPAPGAPGAAAPPAAVGERPAPGAGRRGTDGGARADGATGR